MISSERKDTFEAVWKIQRMMYRPGLFRSYTVRERREPGTPFLGDCVERSDRKTSDQFRTNCEPAIGRKEDRLGRIFAREGLVVKFHHGIPSWMETPWGEWWCWNDCGPGEPMLFGNGKEEAEFRHRVVIDGAESRRGSHLSSYVIRQVENLVIPAFEWCARDHLSAAERRQRNIEWIELCEGMTPKRYPHAVHYIDADLALPKKHPQYAETIRSVRFQGRTDVSGPWTQYAHKHYPAR
ncbi:MAG TPA: hypothetical protein VM103_01530 [Candidatus Paceibacterota bacterium]|nr:hypothetical protein [Candidatus Paceibacterota bacterium]